MGYLFEKKRDAQEGRIPFAMASVPGEGEIPSMEESTLRQRLYAAAASATCPVR